MGKRKTYLKWKCKYCHSNSPKCKFSPCSKPPQFQCWWRQFLHESLAAIPLEGCWFSSKTKWLSSFPWTLLFMTAQLYCLLPALSLTTSVFWKFFAVTKQNLFYYCWMSDSDLNKLACRLLVEMWELAYWEIHKSRFSLLSDSAGERNQ